MGLLSLDVNLKGPLAAASRTAVEAALTLTTGLLLARFAWLVLEPSAGSEMAAARVLSPPADPVSPGALLTQTDLFAASAPERPGLTAPPTTLNLTLAGIRWAGDGHGLGSAILILPDGRQKRVAPGDEIVDGAILDTVTSDGVFLRLDGQLQLLSRARRSGPGMITAPAPAGRDMPTTPPAAGQPVTAAQLMADVSLQPETRGGIVTAYILTPRGAGHFEIAGLQPGDRVIRVNGISVEGMHPQALQTEVMSSQTISLDVVRAGAIRQLRVSPNAGLSQ